MSGTATSRTCAADSDDKNRPLTIAPVYDILGQAVARFADRNALDFFGARMSYGELGRQVDRAAQGLQDLGVGKGVHVGLCLPNTPYSVIFFYAVLRAGGVVVNYNPLYVERELRHQIDDSQTILMVTLDSPQIYPKIAAMLDSSGLQRIVVCPLGAFLPGSPVQEGIPDDDRHVAFDRLMDNDGQPASVEIDPHHDLAVLQYTGGTTGVSKGAMLLHTNLSASTQQVMRLVPFAEGEQERMLVVLPLFHIFALTVGMNFAIAIGAELILLPRFEAEQVMTCIQQKRVTLFPGVPTIYTAINSLAESGRWDLSSIRCCISGGAPLPAEVRSRFEALTGCTLVEGYGLSEANPATCNPFNGQVRDGSIGLPLPLTSIEVRSPQDLSQLLPVGDKGELCVRGPQVMAGYWQRPNDSSVFIDGALRTGDIGYVDQDGYVFLVDRIKDVILCGGYNVFPRVIEEALYQHPAVAEVVVIGIPDSYRGQAPKAFVRLKDGQKATPEQLKAFLADYISPIEMPKLIELRTELPKTSVGKLSKKELVAEELARAQS